MAKPLTWDSPAFIWDAPGVFWDGVEPTKKTMNNVKAIVDFTSYSAPALAPIAQAIHDAMLANAVTFPAPPVTMPDLQTAIDDYMAKLTARESGAKTDQIAFTVSRHALEGDLSDLGNYVNIVANGNPVVVDASGFPSYSTSRTPDYSAPAAPTNLRLRQGEMSGTFTLRYDVPPGRTMNEVQINTGDPNLEANWKPAGLFSGGRASIGNIVPGTTVWARVRTAGLKGLMGAWSDPAKIMVV